MPAPAVIPAPIAYIKVVAVKKLAVGLWGASSPVCLDGVYWLGRSSFQHHKLPRALHWVGGQLWIVYFE